MEKALIVSDQCPACKVLLESLKQHGQLGKYRVLNASSPEGSDVVQKLGITGVPDCIIIVKGPEGEKARHCTEEEIKEILKEASGRE
jgi:predicted thioredoxin/glutaredoxin